MLQGSESLCKLLQYLAHHTLNSPADHLKEYQIGTEVLGRPADFDPQTDSSVRTQVGRLRAKLVEYYNSTGVHDPILVDIPKGRYSLSFERRLLAPRTGNRSRSCHAPSRIRVRPTPLDACRTDRACHRLHGIMDPKSLAMRREFYPWQYKPAVAQFWSGILDARPDTDIVMADSSFSLVQQITKKSFSFEDYRSRSYISQLQAEEDLSPDMRSALNLIAAKNLESRATSDSRNAF